MSKNIADYLHLYLGCEVMLWTDATNPVFEPERKRLVIDAKVYDHITLKTALDVGAKLILRPLSDMSEEEAKELGLNDLAKILYHGTQRVFSFDQVRYLLSKHFDLFNLIGEGLAIDANTLKK